MHFPAAVDRPVAESLRALPGVWEGVAASAKVRPADMFARAELHAVGGVIWDAWKACGVAADAALARKLEARAIARELDHEAHVAMLLRIDAALAVPAVALKGALFASRYYGRPSARGTSDIDILVAESDMERAIESLAETGYRVADDARKVAWALREHHHIHLVRPRAPDVELHFHAHRGFGVTLRTEMLAERSVAMEGFASIRVPSATDELVYLAAHAASHRFGRLAWLHDIRLVLERMTPDAAQAAAARARTWGVARALSLAGELLVEVLGVEPEVVRPLGSLARSRKALVHAVVAEPHSRLLRAVTRFAYTTMLADSMTASLHYAKAYSIDRTRSALGLG